MKPKKPGQLVIAPKGSEPGKAVAIKTPRPLPAVVSEFQPDAVELEERVPPRIARMTLYGVTALIVGAVVWASVSMIDEIVVAPGKLITTQPTIVVQPLETSIIRSIDVAAGDVVHAGQKLVTFDPTFTQSDVDQIEAKFMAFDAQVKRIDAELSGADYTATAGNTPDEMLQKQLFGQRRAFYMAQLQNFDQQIAGQAAALASARDQQAVLQSQSDTLSRIEQTRQALYDKQTGSLLDLLNSRNTRLDVDATLAGIKGTSVEAEHAMAKLKADKQAFIEDFRRATMEQLVQLRAQRDAAAEEKKKMELRRNLVTLTAPADAVVLELAQKSIGSVVREAEPVLTLVPLGVPLEAEVSVNARDIGQVSTGEEARLKFDAYPFQKYGTADGNIRTISRDAFSPSAAGDPQAQASSGGQPFFKARIPVVDAGLAASPDIRLLPGMTVTAEIKVGTRSVISYFLYPLLRGLDDSLKEP
jgi:HlyD family secretion protein